MDLGDIWQVHLLGLMTHCVIWGYWPHTEIRVILRVEPPAKIFSCLFPIQQVAAPISENIQVQVAARSSSHLLLFREFKVRRVIPSLPNYFSSCYYYCYHYGCQIKALTCQRINVRLKNNVHLKNNTCLKKLMHLCKFT